MKKLKKLGALALCLALLAIPLLLTAPEVSAADYIADLPLCFLLKESYTYTGDLSLSVARYGSDQTVIALNEQYFKYLKVTSAGIYVGNSSVLTSMTQIYSFTTGWVDQSWRYCGYLYNNGSYLDASDCSCITFLTDGLEQVFPVGVYYGTVRSDFFLPLSQSVTVSVTVDGFTVTDSVGNANEYVYSGNYAFCGISEANDSLVEYEPGNSYEVLLSSSEKKFYVVDTSMLDYDLSVYGLSGDTVIDNVSSADPIEMNVTSTGATFQLTDQTLSYTYTGTEIFAGFATSTSGSVTYTPGNTYTLDASSTFLYAKETARPTYAASFYDLTGLLIGSTGTSYSPLTLQVTSTGATITLADGEPFAYTYTGTEIFAGFAASSSGAAVYTPGNTYTLSDTTTSLYVKQTVRPTYAALIYDVSGSLFGSTATSYSTLTLQVTSTGATITLADGESLVYTYTGSEIFAGFAAGSSGSVVYSPGKTYTLSAASTSLYAKETPRPTYTVNLYDIGSSDVLAGATSYEYITMQVTSSGAVFTSMGETFEYTYSGTEIFAGFAIFSGGTAEYVPGKTYTLSAASTSLYALETPRPVYTITLYDTSGTAVVGPLRSYFPISFRITGNTVKFTTEEGSTATWTYTGDKQFLGFALDQSADSAVYKPGISYTPKSYDVVLYVHDKVIDLGLIGDVLDVFSGLGGFCIKMLSAVVGVFWSAETGLTFLGALALAGTALALGILLILVCARFLFFRG